MSANNEIPKDNHRFDGEDDPAEALASEALSQELKKSTEKFRKIESRSDIGRKKDPGAGRYDEDGDQRKAS